MTALERLRALRFSEKLPTEVLTELPKAPLPPPSVSFVRGLVGGVPENHAPDSLDDRRHCHQCWQLRDGECLAKRAPVVDDIPRRCFHYLPKLIDPDQRTGRDRWPSIRKPEEA